MKRRGHHCVSAQHQRRLVREAGPCAHGPAPRTRSSDGTAFAHSLATNLRAAGVDLKTAQELLRHANSRITLEIYTRAISSTKREANDKVMQMFSEAGQKQISESSPARLGSALETDFCAARKTLEAENVTAVSNPFRPETLWKSQVRGLSRCSAPSPAPSTWTVTLVSCHKPFLFLGLVAGTAGLEPATSAVTVNRKTVTS